MDQHRKVEYKLLPVGGLEFEQIHHVLQELGQEGWTMESALEAGGGGSLDILFKRSIEIA